MAEQLKLCNCYQECTAWSANMLVASEQPRLELICLTFIA